MLRFLILHLLVPLCLTAIVVVASLFLATSVPPQWHTPAMLCIYALIVSAIVVFTGAYLRVKLWESPVEQLGMAAERMGRGEWNVRVHPRGAGAVRHMAGSLNLLAAQAQKQLADLKQQRGGLQTLVDTLPDPFLAVDTQGRITLWNAPAARLFSLRPEQAMAQKIVSVVNDEQIVELYEALLSVRPAATAPMHREVRIARGGQRLTYQAVATRNVAGGALLVLRDVSTLAGAVQMKTDFVANASHELRTPIAAIKIAFETLRDVYREDPVQSDRCIAVIEGHLRRLEEMLRDLLDLSRVESSDVTLKVAEVKTSELFSVLRSTLSAAAKQKGVELVLGVEPTTPEEFRSDSRLLNLMLKNLVENSIKFTPTGGRVAVKIQPIAPPTGNSTNGEWVAISVADTGIGIAPEHLDRVFERFYQVDSARSGSAGRGTGLGLAIVKHAVSAMGGTVKIESKVNQGTTVRCEIPQKPATPDEESEEA
jgi:two-component system, OmpR family, phosphate regulon sensor histidine kinase PhoR